MFINKIYTSMFMYIHTYSGKMSCKRKITSRKDDDDFANVPYFFDY